MRVLVAEDDKILGGVIRRLFEPIVDECTVSCSLKETKEKLMSSPPFDIVTLDLNLPDSRGLETIERIRELKELSPNSIIIVYTGITSPEIRQAALDAGADGFLSKADTASCKGGFLGSFQTVIKNIISQPMRYNMSINLLEKLVNKISEEMSNGSGLKTPV